MQSSLDAGRTNPDKNKDDNRSLDLPFGWSNSGSPFAPNLAPKEQTMLEMMRTLFQLRGFLAGYKTYLAASAGVMATLAQFISGQMIPYIDGDTTMIALLEGLPALVAQLSVYFAVGALRAGVEGKR